MKTDQRTYGIRRDINDLVRGVDGKISGSKVGTYYAQFLSGKVLLAVTPVNLPTWDVLAVLFLVLIAPEAYKQMMAMKWGGALGTTTVTDTNIQKREVTK